MRKMELKCRQLLILDGIVNLFLGTLLLFFPEPLVRFLGIPDAEVRFYPSILGAVLVGVALALFMEGLSSGDGDDSEDRSGTQRNARRGLRGLGLGGAVVINLCGAGVLALWLVFGSLDLPPRGLIALWFVAVVVLALSFFEIFAMRFKTKDENP